MTAGADLPDERLLSRARDGDLAAFNVLVERYQDPLFALCVRLLGDRQAAEDATQEAFLSAYRALASFSGGNVRSWLFRIAANECKDELRRRRRKDVAGSLDQVFGAEETPHEVPDPGAGPADFALDRESAAQVGAALASLPLEQREAIVLVDLYDFRYEEVAQITGASVGTVKSRIFRGRERLRQFVLAHPELFEGAHRLAGGESRR